MAEPGQRRKGARRMSEIPPDVLRSLQQGREETRTLVEWLAVDLAVLLGHVLPETSLPEEALERVLGRAHAARELGVMGRLRDASEALASEGGPALRVELSNHASDIVRSLACGMIPLEARRAPEELLAEVRPFADDSNMSVREMAWTVLRPRIIEEPETWLRVLAPWARDASANVRRCAVEATRPRAVWAPRLPATVERPELGLPILEPVRSDPSRYVQTAVGNWLNDASKSRPGWVEETCARWTRESPTPMTAWIVRHATRTLRKGDEASKPSRGRGKSA